MEMSPKDYTTIIVRREVYEKMKEIARGLNMSISDFIELLFEFSRTPNVWQMLGHYYLEKQSVLRKVYIKKALKAEALTGGDRKG